MVNSDLMSYSSNENLLNITTSESLRLKGGGGSHSLEISLPSSTTIKDENSFLVEPYMCGGDTSAGRKRFTIVKTETTAPFKRGRWKCMDFLGDGPFEQIQQSGDEANDLNCQCFNVNSIAHSRNVMNKEIFERDGATSKSDSRKIMSNDFNCTKNINVTKDSNHITPLSIRAIEMAIDSKIEEAIELVKGHLVQTIREALKVFTDKVDKLTARVKQLESENSFLKANATIETLEQLSVATANLTNERFVES